MKNIIINLIDDIDNTCTNTLMVKTELSEEDFKDIINNIKKNNSEDYSNVMIIDAIIENKKVKVFNHDKIYNLEY